MIFSSLKIDTLHCYFSDWWNPKTQSQVGRHDQGRVKQRPFPYGQRRSHQTMEHLSGQPGDNIDDILHV